MDEGGARASDARGDRAIDLFCSTLFCSDRKEKISLLLRCVLYKSFSPIAQFQHLIASPFN
jgi:hypothetical protein